MSLMKFFFFVSRIAQMFFLDFSREQFTDSAVKLSQTKKYFLKITLSLNGHRVFSIAPTHQL